LLVVGTVWNCLAKTLQRNDARLTMVPSVLKELDKCRGADDSRKRPQFVHSFVELVERVCAEPNSDVELSRAFENRV